VPGRASRYNAGVNVDRCSVCGAAAEETHHIVPQAVAAPHVRHRRHNLAPLCGKCHARVHAGEISIDRYASTSDGLRLLVGAYGAYGAYPPRRGECGRARADVERVERRESASAPSRPKLVRDTVLLRIGKRDDGFLGKVARE
jgi:hypothetical protein